METSTFPARNRPGACGKPCVRTHANISQCMGRGGDNYAVPHGWGKMRPATQKNHRIHYPQNPQKPAKLNRPASKKNKVLPANCFHCGIPWYGFHRYGAPRLYHHHFFWSRFGGRSTTASYGSVPPTADGLSQLSGNRRCAPDTLMTRNDP